MRMRVSSPDRALNPFNLHLRGIGLITWCLGQPHFILHAHNIISL